MYTCTRCRSRPAVAELPYARARLCGECFSEFFARRVARTVEELELFDPRRDVIAIAVSGGKDSASLLHALVKAYPDSRFKALHVNMGILGYSDRAELASERLASELGVELKVYDVREEEGISVDLFEATSYRGRACAACSAIRRRLIDKVAIGIGADVIATGHNLDDFLAIATKLLVSGDLAQLARLAPRQPPLAEGYPAKAKPLIRTGEEEAELYSRLNGLPVVSIKCPHSPGAKQDQYKRLMDELEGRSPGFKLNLLASYLKLIGALRGAGLAGEAPRTKCRVCGLPSDNEVCSSCARITLARRVAEELGISPGRPELLLGAYPAYGPPAGGPTRIRGSGGAEAT